MSAAGSLRARGLLPQQPREGLVHGFMAPEGLPVAIITAALWLVVFSQVRSAFAGLLPSKVPSGRETAPSGASVMGKS